MSASSSGIESHDRVCGKNGIKDVIKAAGTPLPKLWPYLHAYISLANQCVSLVAESAVFISYSAGSSHARQMVPVGCWVRSFEGAWIENNSSVFDLPQSVHFPALYISSIILSLHRKIHLKSRPGFPQDYKDHWFQNTRGFMSGLFFRQVHGAVVVSWVQFVKI